MIRFHISESADLSAVDAEVRKALDAGDGSRLPLRRRIEWHHVVERLEAQDALERRVVEGDRCHASMRLRRGRGLHRNTPAGTTRLSRFAFVHVEENRLVLESPAAAGRLVLHTPDAVAVLARLAGPDAGAFTGIDAEIVELLRQGGLLERDAERTGAAGMWEFHDRLFHEWSRLGNRPVGRAERGPALLSAGFCTRTPLPRPAARLAMPLGESLGARRSERAFDAHRPLTLVQLAEFLHHVTQPGASGHRPSPSAGGLNAVGLWVVAERVEGLGRGIYRHDAAGHHLENLLQPPDRARPIAESGAMLTGNRGSVPAAVIVLTGNFARIMSKYRGVAYASLLKDAGALLQTMSLVASAMGLGGCVLGAGDPADFAAATGRDPWIEGSIAEFLVGMPDPTGGQ